MNDININRAKALKWWRWVDEEEQKEIANLHFPAMEFELVTASSNRIEFMWKKQKSKYHATQIVKMLTSRPHLEDRDGYYDITNDEIQMIDIVENYITNHDL